MKNKKWILGSSLMVVAGLAVFFGVHTKDAERKIASQSSVSDRRDQGISQLAAKQAEAPSDKLNASKDEVARKLKADPEFNKNSEFMKNFMLDHLDEVLALQKAGEDAAQQGYAKIEREFWEMIESRQNQRVKAYIDNLTPQQKEEFDREMKKKENIEGFVKEQRGLQFKPEDTEIDPDLFPSR